jgi:two-component system, OmpR family, sensor histidine kinase KdpD
MTVDTHRGRLRLYLGAAPGVGKTYAMLGEGHRRHGRGTDVVVALVETHGRAPVEEQLRGLENVAPTVVGTEAGPAEVVDVDAVLRRAPQVVLVDDLSSTNPPGSRHAKRWQDVEELLEAGIDVISTIDIEHLESLSDVVHTITGVPQRESVPDHVVRAADQIELVDMTPEALRRRMAHGNIYPADRVDAALSQYFRVGNLAALRELALLWLADRVDEGLERYRRDHHIDSTWAARERVVVALTGGPEGEALLRRGARIAARGAGGELHAVYVAGKDQPAPPPDQLARLRVLTEELGGQPHTVMAGDPAEAVLALARSLNASQIVLGVSRRPRWRGLLRPGVSERVIAGSEDIDVLVVTHAYARQGTVSPGRSGPLGPRRLAAGWVLAIVGPALLSIVLVPTRDLPTLALEAMSYLALTVVCALVGGLWPALTAAVLGSLLLNWYFTPPQNTLTIADTINVVALAMFLVVAVAVASVVDKAARRSIQADLARREADTLTLLNRTLLRSDHGVQAVLGLVQSTFGVRAAALLRRTPDGWEILGSVGDEPPAGPDTADATAEVSSTLVLALRGVSLQPHERRVLAAFATHLAVVLERQELAERAEAARALEQGNRVRTALLAAVSHDLRTPLAGIKAAVSSLRSSEVEWSEHEEAALLETVEDSADRLHTIVANLLDLSRLQSDAVRPVVHEIGLDDVVSRTIADMPGATEVQLRLAPDLPPVLADAGLLDRVVANLVDNALRHSPPGRPVTVSTGHVGDRVQLHVVDHGPGVPDSEKERMFAAFQRLGDTEAREGLGLGLAVARGLTEALGGLLIAENTPGGGLTMVLDLPAVPSTERGPLAPVERA